MAELSTHKKAIACIALVTLALAGGARETKADLKYEIIRLSWPDPNCNFSFCSSINNNGEVIGISGEEGPRGVGFIWLKYFLYRNGVMRELNLGENYPKNVINDWGDILAKGDYKSAIYKIDERIQFGFWGSDMNNKGEVAGYYGYLYRNGEKIDLSAPGSGLGYKAHAINDNTQVVGYLFGYDWFCGFLWEEGITTRLEDFMYAYDINNKEHIVGKCKHGGRPCLWEDGSTRILEMPKDSGTGAAFAINDRGQIVGSVMYPYMDPVTGRRGIRDAAFLYENGKAIILNDLLLENSEWWLLERALDINNKGQIIGYGYVEDDSHLYAFLMNPIPLRGDLNDDGIVNFEDFSIFANQWLEIEAWYE